MISASNNNEPMTVCILDDDASVLKAVSRLLVSAGWEVEAFDDPASFLRYAQDHRPRVVVIDIWMPVMNGLEVQTRLRDVSPTTRVIVLTAKDDPLTRSRAMDAGAFAFFLKPADEAMFVAGIEASFSNN